MVFPGIKDPKERADVIAFLRSLSPNPQPLPEKK
jgi:cytochrome c2